MRAIEGLFRLFFRLLYHQFAWTYDLVAAVVSLGRWQDWVRGVLPFIKGRQVLELGPGPGHLQVTLNEKGFQSYGLDESRQMLRQCGRLLRRNSLQSRLSRGYAQNLPFRAGCFDTVLATFPTEYIYEPATLSEVRRVLTPDGRLVLLPVAWITGASLPERLAAGLFRLTGQAPERRGELPAVVIDRFAAAGFQVRTETIAMNGSLLLFLLAEPIQA